MQESPTTTTIQEIQGVILVANSPSKKASPGITPGGSENNKQQDIFLNRNESDDHNLLIDKALKDLFGNSSSAAPAKGAETTSHKNYRNTVQSMVNINRQC